MPETMTICAKCKHHDFRGTIWYDLFCGHPKVASAGGIDPVTGQTTEEHPPYCRDINKHGACKLYED